MEVWYRNKVSFKCGEYYKDEGGYFNSNSGKFVSRRYEWMGKDVPEKYILYEFKEFNFLDISKLFEYQLIERVSRFLSLLYRKEVSGVSDRGFCYVSKKELTYILGGDKHRGIIKVLLIEGIIEVKELGSSKYNSNKKLIGFKPNEVKIVNSEKRIKYVVNRQLFNSLSKINKEGLDRYLRFEVKSIKKVDLNDEDIDEIILNRIEFKINEDVVKYSSDLFLKPNDRRKAISRLNDTKNWWSDNYYENYRKQCYRNYDLLKFNLESIVNDDYYGLLFSDSNSGRMYNGVNLIMSDLRKKLLIDGDRVVEVDMKTGYLSLLYFLNLILLGDIDIGGVGKEIKKRLPVKVSGEFVEKYRDCFEGDRLDFYEFVGLRLGEIDVIDTKEDRGYIKNLVLRLLNGKKLYDEEFVRRWGMDYDELMEFIFYDMYEVIEYIKNNDVFKDYSYDNVFGKISFFLYSNMSRMLMKLEVIVMKMVFDELIKNSIYYVSLFDGFMIGESNVNKTLGLVKDKMSYLKCIRFKAKNV
tara:strand:+ start:4254 stop:5825 length:1572 start_codon:yes stop_codon:yes gene_type:complete